MLTKGRSSVILLLLFVSITVAKPLYAATDITTFTNNLNDLILQGNELVAAANTINLVAPTMSSQLANGSVSVNNYLQNVQAVYDSLAGSNNMVLTNESLLALQTLSATIAGLAEGLLRVAGQVVNLASFTSLTSLQSSLDSMLRLADDIGTMADRIGEMADRILIMADNIGIMADRILATQLIQNANIELAFNAILETQKNILMLFSMYNL